MKRTITNLATAGMLMQFATRAYAALPQPPGISGLSNQTDIKQTIVDILVKVLDFIAILGVVYIVIAGIMLITSGGDEGQKDKAKKTIIYVIAGIIILFARVIVSFFAGIA